MPSIAWLLVVSPLVPAALVAMGRARARRRRRYVRLRVVPYRGDDAQAQEIVSMLEALHKRLLRRWWRRLLSGQPSMALEVHGGREAWLAVVCPAGLEGMAQAAVRGAYPNCRLRRVDRTAGEARAPMPSRCVVRLKKHATFIRRVERIDRFEHERSPAMNRLMTAMAASGAPALVQLALTPTPALFEAYAKWAYKHRESRLSRERREHLVTLDRSLVEDAELRGGLAVQHRPLFFADVRIVAGRREACERIASQLRAEGAENRLVERGTAVRHGLFGLYRGRVRRGEGNPLPSWRKGVFASTELAALWHLPSIDFATVPFARSALPLAPAPPAIMRPREGRGTLRDEHGPVSIHEGLRCQNTAVTGTVGQGKSSYLVASVAEDLRRERCAVIVLDPKGDAAGASVSLVPRERACTLLDLSDPSLRRALLGGSPAVDFDRVIVEGEVLVVNGALAAVGARDASALMQLLVGMLDAALARNRARRPPRGMAVALKVDDAPLALSRSFLETLALKRQAGLETVACWQADAQWTDRRLREQLDALFAHRVYFATASVTDARHSSRLLMAEFSDTVRPGIRNLSALGRPDARLHLPSHCAIASWVTPRGRQAPFVARTLPLPASPAAASGS